MHLHFHPLVFLAFKLPSVMATTPITVTTNCLTKSGNQTHGPQSSTAKHHRNPVLFALLVKTFTHHPFQ